MKFLLIVLGLQSALAQHSCMYCKADVAERINPEVEENFFWADEIRRTLSEMQAEGGKGKAVCGQLWEPLMPIDPSTGVIVDELHLTMRVTERLLNALIEGAVHLDGETSAIRRTNGLRFREIISHIRAIVPTFRAFISDNKIDFTALWGGDQIRLLENMPKNFDTASYLPSNIRDAVTELWSLFKQLHEIFSAKQLTDAQINAYYGIAVKFEKIFLKIGNTTTLPGYQPKDYTAYMHIMVN